ncbi:fungal-specific transcription factor [Aspergillus floccosus]
MNHQKPLKRISCSRCQSKKIRCNRADPQCDKCEVVGAECTYLPRRQRAKKRSAQVDEKDLLPDILRRLERLEDHCKLDRNDERYRGTSRSGSISSADANVTTRFVSTSVDLPDHDKSHFLAAPGVPYTTLDRTTYSRSPLFSNVFCHLRNIESRFFGNERCVKVMEAVFAEMEYPDGARMTAELGATPTIPKEMARKWVQNYYDSYRFQGFTIPFEKDFLMSIPDLLENPHVQLDHPAQIIYYNVLLHGILSDTDDAPNRKDVLLYLSSTCTSLTETWIDQIKDTPADLLAATLMISTTLESCNTELTWKILGHACEIARNLGYFSVDQGPEPRNGQGSRIVDIIDNETDAEKNRKRFEFWHLLRADCLFRLSFGKPALIPAGSWKVNFPNPSIDSIEFESTRFIQIHFLASMRLTLVMMKYLDLVDAEAMVNDATFDSLISEVQSIISGWNPEELLTTTTNHIDSWLCADLLFSSYKLLIIFDQSKSCNYSNPRLSHHTVDIARKSVMTFQSLMGSATYSSWGTSLVLLHQFVPLFILCLNIIESNQDDAVEGDVALVTWASEFVDRTAEERVELRQAMVLMRAMCLASQPMNLNCL